MAIITNINLQYKIIKFEFDYSNSSLSITVAQGIETNGVFETLTIMPPFVIVGNDALTLFTSSVDSTKNIYENMKAILYTYLTDSGLLVGTIN